MPGSLKRTERATPRWGALLLIAAVVPGCAGTASAPGGDASPPDEPEPSVDGGPPVIQPGAPGEPSREVRPEELRTVAGQGYTEADVRFMRGMILHHAQALEMVDLMPGRAASRELRRLGLRIEISQRDEIGLMERWLERRGEEPPAWEHPVHEHGELMPGMLTAEQMEALAAARGEAFDSLFLELMIVHHEGAVRMVRDLFASPGAAEDSEIFRFASDVDADQVMEIRRMRQMLAELRDP